MTERVSDALDALVEAAPDGVECDGLRVEPTDGDAFRVETPAGAETVAAADLRAALVEHGPYVANWYHWRRTVADRSPDRYAFLRWIEAADERPAPERHATLREGGVEREWGDLLVTARLAADAPTPGARRYDLRPAADAGTPAAELTTYDDPLALREPTTYDDRGRYRPLRTAPSLPTGWACPDLGARDLVEAVEVVYPATVANWHREREGDLDVTHWDETAARQTGIYGIVSELPDEAVGWVAEACCVDSQCLKRREWDRSADDPLDAERGEGAFPCREPCSLVVAAARRWTTLEREAARTYEFELTPSEKEQVEAIVEAVAEGRTDEIREADVYEGANRYRARYLRAKRFDETGNLSGTPTDAADDEHGDEH